MTSRVPPQVAIIGAGAIGGLFAARLTEANIPTTLVARNSDAATWLKKQGITVVDASTVNWFKVSASSLGELVEAPDVLILAVKTFDLASVFVELADVARRVRQIICVQSSLCLAQHVPAEFHEKTLAAALMVGASGNAGGL